MRQQPTNDIPYLMLVLLWVSQFFRQPAPPAPRMLEAAPAPEPTRRARKAKPDPEEDTGFPNTLADLLERLEFTFNQVKLPAHKNSWLSPESAMGLRRLGVHVPNPWHWYDDEKPIVRLRRPNRLPGIMSISTTPGIVNAGDKEHSYPSFMFAIKAQKLPYSVTQHKGIPYEFGMGYGNGEDILWVFLWMVVGKDGELHVCNELRNETLHIPVKTPQARRAFGPQISVHRHDWRRPSMIDDPFNQVAYEVATRNMKSAFRQLHDWWTSRDDRWSVAVKKGGDRVTFAIDKENTATYFADRDKSAKTPSGATKKIFHFVREHDRILGEDRTTTVRAHTRGLREFDWGAYHCKIIAPEFDNVKPGSFFPLASIDESEARPGEKLIGLDEFGSRIAQEEDTPRRYMPRKKRGVNYS